VGQQSSKGSSGILAVLLGAGQGLLALALLAVQGRGGGLLLLVLFGRFEQGFESGFPLLGRDDGTARSLIF
jgi:hypothetical protein